MSPTRHCTSCGTELEIADRFCPSCGREAVPPAPAGGKKTCPLCGQENPSGASSCGACGASIGQPIGTGAQGRKQVPPRRDAGPGFLQSWKFTAGVGATLVAALIIFVITGTEPEKTQVQADPHDAGMMRDIKALQARIDADPEDREAVLQMANRLYDIQFFDRAALMYERYLKLDPGNLDARVDLGTSYFQMSFSDSVQHDKYQKMAESAFLEAVRTDPRHQLANFNLGIIHLHRGDIPVLSQHLQNNPT